MYRFIVNPHSRSGKAAEIWEKLKKHLEEKQIAFDFALTERAGHATLLTREAMEAFRAAGTDPLQNRLVLLGGDGTLNEALNGMNFQVPFSLGYIPTGSGCDFARGMGLPTEPEQALQAILQADSIRLLDCGCVDTGDGPRRFAVSCGVGYDAAVCHQSFDDPSKEFFNRIHMGKLSYLWIGLQQIIRLHPADGRLKVQLPEGKTEELELKDIGFVSAHIQPYEGGGFKFAPKADPADGLLDVCAVTESSSGRIVRPLLASIFEKHLSCRGVHYFQCREAELTLKAPLPGHADGELNGKPTVLRLSCLPKCLPLLTSGAGK